MTPQEKSLSQVMLKLGLLVHETVEEGKERAALFQELQAAYNALLREHEEVRGRHTKIVDQFKQQLAAANADFIRSEERAEKNAMYWERYQIVDEERRQLEKEVESLEDEKVSLKHDNDSLRRERDLLRQMIAVIEQESAESTEPAGSAELPDEIDDTDFCPVCDTPHLIAIAGNKYECAGCSTVFCLAMRIKWR
jgi:DNA repair exonuclease SbcCD ATPase subunit